VRDFINRRDLITSGKRPHPGNAGERSGERSEAVCAGQENGGEDLGTGFGSRAGSWQTAV